MRLKTLHGRLSYGTGLTPMSCCYTCLLPLRVCRHLKDLEETTECVYPKLVRVLLVICEHYLEESKDTLFLNALGIGNFELRPRRGDSTGILDYSRRSTKLFGTDAIEACRILNDLSVVKIVGIREDQERQNRRKRYWTST